MTPSPKKSMNPSTAQASLDQQLRGAPWASNHTLAARLTEAGASVHAKDDPQQSPYLIATSESDGRAAKTGDTVLAARPSDERHTRDARRSAANALAAGCHR